MKTRWLMAGVALALTSTGPAHAAGLYLPGTGAQSSGRSEAFAAKGGDPTTLFHNPAGMLSLKGTHFTIYTGMIFNPSSFERKDENFETGEPEETYDTTHRTNSPGFIPGIFAVSDFGLEDWRFGIGAHGPYGTPTTKFSPSGPARYQVTQSTVGQIFYEFGTAYRATPDLDLGGALVLSDVFVNYRLNIHSDFFNTERDPRSDARAQFTLNDTFKPTWLIGGRYRAGPLTFAASWLGQVKFLLRGGIKATLPNPENMPDPNGALVAQTLIDQFGYEYEAPARLDIWLPDVVKTGVMWQINPDWDIEFDYHWIRWSNIVNYPLRVIGHSEPTEDDPEGNDPKFFNLVPIKDGRINVNKRWENVHSFHLGSDYTLSDAITVRGGFIYEPHAIPDETTEPSNVDLNKYGPSMGMSWRPEFLRGEGSQWSLDLGAHLMFGKARTIHNSQAYLNIFNDPVPDVSTNGVYKTTYQVFSAGIAGQF